jgi:predicted enzyme related to lactoylglutathione lyase
MDWALEVIVVPVTDVDRAKMFYSERAGFNVDVDYRTGEEFRVVQLTPPGSSCSIVLMRNPKTAGALQGLQVVVSDIDEARRELAGRGVDVSELFHFQDGKEIPGPEPQRQDYATFFSFSDPDGNAWLIQEVRSRGAAS